MFVLILVERIIKINTNCYIDDSANYAVDLYIICVFSIILTLGLADQIGLGSRIFDEIFKLEYEIQSLNGLF